MVRIAHPPDSVGELAVSPSERLFVKLYGAGFLLYVGTAAVVGWSRLSLGDWLAYIGSQAFIYGPVWPSLLVTNLLGFTRF